MLDVKETVSVFRNKRSLLLAPQFRGLARRPRTTTLVDWGLTFLSPPVVDSGVLENPFSKSPCGGLWWTGESLF